MTISGNVIEDVYWWEGLDTHSGSDLVFADNVVHNCALGISITPSGNAAGQYAFPASKNISITGNTIRSDFPWAGQQGICFAGCQGSSAANYNSMATGTITGNTIIGYGDPANNIQGQSTYAIPAGWSSRATESSHRGQQEFTCTTRTTGSRLRGTRSLMPGSPLLSVMPSGFRWTPGTTRDALG